MVVTLRRVAGSLLLPLFEVRVWGTGCAVLGPFSSEAWSCFQYNLEPEGALLVLGMEEYESRSGDAVVLLAAAGHVCLQMVFPSSLCSTWGVGVQGLRRGLPGNTWRRGHSGALPPPAGEGDA